MTNAPIRDLHVGKYLALRIAGTHEYVERLNASGCVLILARTEADELILVEQYRVALRRRVIALPAGLAGDHAGSEKEKLAEAAQRELEEETGYRAASMRFLMEGPSSSGMSSEILTFFRAEGVRQVEGLKPDEDEEIIRHLVPMADLFTWLRAREREGFLIDYKIYAALHVADSMA
jgi:ADP-ribose pyrophosphatase